MIAEAERRLAAARDAEQVVGTPTFVPIVLPRIDLDELEVLLVRSLPDLEQTALAQVQEHIALLGRDGEAWVGRGMELTQRLSEQGHGECPFCAQPLHGSPILAHYQAYFGAAYHELKREIDAAVQEFQRRQSEDIPAAFERAVREAVERQGFWRVYAEVPAIQLDTAAVSRLWKAARREVEGLLDAKRTAPLDAIAISAEARVAIA